jgi:hypothetical protein
MLPRFSPGGISLDIKLGPRIGSFLSKLPLKLKGMFARLTPPKLGIEDIWKSRGFAPMFSLGTPTLPNFALVFSFDLGSLGGLVDALKGLEIDIAIGWAGSSCTLAARLPEIKGGERSFGINGILKLHACDLQFHQSPKGNIFLLLRKAQLEILGKRFPPPDESAVGGLVITDTKHPKPAWIVAAAWKDQFLAIGQSLEFTPRSKTTKDIVKDLRGMFVGYDFGADCKAMQPKPPAKADDVLDTTDPKQLRYSAAHNWIFGLHLDLAAFLPLQLDLVLNDPTLYGIGVRVAIFDLDVLYRRVADGIGMFHIDTSLPIKELTAGTMKLSLPNIGLSIFTDGGFKLDLGFPTAMDFARSFHFEMTPYGGAGGFYFALFRTAGSDLLPTPDKYKTVLQAGIGFRVGYSVSLKVGPFSAKATLSVYAMLEGALGFLENAAYTNPDIAVRGRLGVMVSLQCRVDLVLTALEFDLDVWAGMEVVVRILCGELCPVDVTFEVGVRVRIRWVIARFKIFRKKFEIAVTLSFERTIRYTTTLGEGGKHCVPHLLVAAVAPLALDESVWTRAITDPDAHAIPQIDLFFIPEVALTETSSVNVIAQLGIERSPHFEPDAVPPPVSWEAFDRLLAEVIRWAARACAIATGAHATPLRFTKAELEAWRKQLADDGPLAPRGLTYEVIEAFLAARTKLRVVEAKRALRLTTFPVFSTLQVRIDPSPLPVPASRFDGSRYTPEDEKELARILKLGTGVPVSQAATANAAPSSRPLSQLLMQEYFDSLIRMAVTDLVQVGDNTDQPLDTLIEKVRRVRGTHDAFAAIASTVSTQTLHGLRIPGPKSLPTSPGKSVFERTGQAIQLFPRIPDTFPGKHAVILETIEGEASILPKFSVTEALSGQEDFAALVELGKSFATPPQRHPLHALALDRTQARSFALVAASKLPDARLVLGFPAELVHCLEHRHDAFALAPFWSAADDDRAGTKPPERIDGHWCLRFDLELMRPPQEQNARNVFEIVGASDNARRLLQRYLESTDAQAAKVAVFTARKPSRSEPAVLEDLAATDVMCVMTNTARRSNPATTLAATTTGLPDLTISARPGRAVEFLRLLWSASIVRDGGFVLSLPIDATNPRLVWSEAGRTSLVVVVELAATTQRTPVWANAVRLAPVATPARLAEQTPALSVGYSLAYIGKDDPDGLVRTALAQPGVMVVELLRKDPDRTHAAVPALGIPAGLRTEELSIALAQPHLAALSFDREQLERELGVANVEAQASYRLLALEIIGDESDVAPFRRPMSPRTIEGPDDKQSAAMRAFVVPLAPGLEGTDWCYRYGVDVTTLFKAYTGLYSLVSKQLTFALAWRDAYGNNAPGTGWSWTEPLTVEYVDRLIPIAEWPGVRAEWTAATNGNDRLVRVVLTYTPPSKRDEAKPKATRTKFEEERWCLIAEQLKGRAVAASIQHPLGDKSDGSYPVPIGELVLFADEINKTSTSTVTRALNVKGKVVTWPESRRELKVSIRVEREDHVHEAAAPDVQRVTSPVPAVAEAVDSFATKLETAFPELRLALGDVVEGTSERSLWAVRADLLAPSVKHTQSPQWARFCAPAPLHTELVSVDDPSIQVPELVDDKDDGYRAQWVPLRGQDPDVLMRTFLHDMEVALRHDVFVVARRLATAGSKEANALDDLVRAKFAIARAVKPLVAPVLESEKQVDFDDASDVYVEAARKDLRQVYAVDSIVQYSLEVAPVTAPELLYGDVMVQSKSDGSRPPIAVSRARAWVCPKDKTATLSLLVDQISETHRTSFVDATLKWRITHVAQPEDGKCGDDLERYRGMRWLQIVHPGEPRDLWPKGESGSLQIPLPVRVYPTPPTILGHKAEPPASPPADLLESTRWRYRLEYQEIGAIAGNDQIHATLRYEKYAAQPRAHAFQVDAKSLQRLVATLVGWQRAAPEVLKRIEVARTRPPATTTDPVFAAYKFLGHIAREVSTQLAAATATGPRLFGADDHPDIDVDVLTYPVAKDCNRVGKLGIDYTVGGTPRTLAASGNVLRVFKWSAATAELQISRNRNLLGKPYTDLVSNMRFIYMTDRVAAGDWVRASISHTQPFVGAPAPGRGKPRKEAIEATLRKWLSALDATSLDLVITSSFVFDARARPITSDADLALATIVPLGLEPQAFVTSIEKTADAVAQHIQDALPEAIHATNSAVLVQLTAFAHGSPDGSGTGEYSVYQVKLLVPLLQA